MRFQRKLIHINYRIILLQFLVSPFIPTECILIMFHGPNFNRVCVTHIVLLFVSQHLVSTSTWHSFILDYMLPISTVFVSFNFIFDCLIVCSSPLLRQEVHFYSKFSWFDFDGICSFKLSLRLYSGFSERAPYACYTVSYSEGPVPVVHSERGMFKAYCVPRPVSASKGIGDQFQRYILRDLFIYLY